MNMSCHAYECVMSYTLLLLLARKYAKSPNNYIYICIYTHMYVSIYVYTYMYVYTHICMYLHMYIHIHIHTCTSESVCKEPIWCVCQKRPVCTPKETYFGIHTGIIQMCTGWRRLIVHCIYTYIYIHLYIHYEHIYTCMCIYICICKCVQDVTLYCPLYIYICMLYFHYI